MGASLSGGGGNVTVNVDRTVAAGTHVENEPIIKSDGAGPVMQWDNSNQDANEGIYFVEGVDGGTAGVPLRLGIGVAAPTVPLTVKSHVAAAADIILAQADDDGNVFRVGKDASDNGYLELFDGAGNIDVKLDTAAASTFANAASTVDNLNTTAKLYNSAANTCGLQLVDNAGKVCLQSVSGALQIWTDSQTQGNNFVAGDMAMEVGNDGAVKITNATTAQMQIESTGSGHDTKLEFVNTTGTGSEAHIYFSDDSAGTGRISYAHNAGGETDVMNFYTAGAKQFSIGSGGGITVGSLDIGHGAGGDTSSTAVGLDALSAVSHADADFNTAIGGYAADALQGGSGAGHSNTAVGTYAFSSSLDGSKNTAVGKSALHSTDCANDNTAIGYNALKVFGGSDTTAVGSGAGESLTNGAANTAVGYQSLDGTDDGARNTALGSVTLSANCADDNTALGYSALIAFTGSDATAVGSGALDSATGVSGGTYLTAVGRSAMTECTIGSDNTAVGALSLGTVDGGQNTAVGFQALNADCVSDNTGIGKNALLLFTGSNATAVGSGAGDSLTSGLNNTTVGKGSLATTDDGANNVAMGVEALGTGNCGDNNTALGFSALYAFTVIKR